MKYQSFAEMPLLLRVSDLADTLDIGRNAAYNLVNSGAIPCLRIQASIRVPRDAVINFIRNGSRTA